MLSALALLLASGAHAQPLEAADFTSLAPLFAPGVPTTIDTDALTWSDGGGTLHTGVLHDGRVAVFAFGAVALTRDVAVVGARPLAVLSQTDLSLEAMIDASAALWTPGPGGYAGNNDIGGGTGYGPGGGMGPSVDPCGGAGFGGEGGVWNPSFGYPTGAPYGDLLLMLEGGSGGGRCGNTYAGTGQGGGGGGAVQLGAAGSLTVAAAGAIVVDGADGTAGTWPAQGGGGGSGGGIFLHATGGACSGVLSASGGSGGMSYEVGGIPDRLSGGGAGGRIDAVGLSMAACAVDLSGGPGHQAGGDGVLRTLASLHTDADGDGLDWYEEYVLGTDPLLPDTDGDGGTDAEEVVWGTDPLEQDTDGDHLPDGAEVYAHGTSPLLQDTDGDGIRDDVELGSGFDPTDPSHPSFAAMPLAEVPGSVVLDVNGDCPGPVHAHLAGLTPGAPFAVLGGARGSHTVGAGLPCAGTDVHLAAPTAVWSSTADPAGRADVAATLGVADCAGHLQVVDLATCAVSAVESLGAPAFDIGSEQIAWTGAPAFGGNVFAATRDRTLRRVGVNLDLAGRCDVDFYLFESTGGPWAPVWSQRLSAGPVSSGQVGVDLDPGVPIRAGSTWLVGAGWTCATPPTMHAGAGTGADDFGLGTFVGRTLDLGYGGYDPAYAPTPLIADGVAYDFHYVLTADELCTDGADNDADGLVDCEDGDCSFDPSCVELACSDGVDDDDDGLTDCDDDDCWGPACSTRIVSWVRDGSVDGEAWERDHLMYSSFYWQTTTGARSADLTLRDVRGRVQVDRSGALVTCDWSYASADVRTTSSQWWSRTYSSYGGGTTEWSGGTHARTLARRGLVIEPGCQLAGSAFLPRALEIRSAAAGLGALAENGALWFAGAATPTVLSSSFRSTPVGWFGWASTSSVRRSWSAPSEPAEAYGVCPIGAPELRGSDADGDGFAGMDELTAVCDPAEDPTLVPFGPWTRDCAPGDPAIHPGAPDLTVDGVDQDCDGVDGS